MCPKPVVSSRGSDQLFQRAMEGHRKWVSCRTGGRIWALVLFRTGRSALFGSFSLGIAGGAWFCRPGSLYPQLSRPPTEGHQEG